MEKKDEIEKIEYLKEFLNKTYLKVFKKNITVFYWELGTNSIKFTMSNHNTIDDITSIIIFDIFNNKFYISVYMNDYDILNEEFLVYERKRKLKGIEDGN